MVVSDNRACKISLIAKVTGQVVYQTITEAAI